MASRRRWHGGRHWCRCARGVTGLRVDGDDVATVTSALSQLLTDPMRARLMGEAGLTRVHAEFAWERVAEKTRGLHMQMQGNMAMRRHVL